MKSFAFCAALLLACFACNVDSQAGEMDSQTFAAIGLSEVTPMTDAQGEEVRAKGFVWGESTATSYTWGGYATSTNGYVNWNSGTTYGGNISAADASVFGPGAPTAVAGGFSFTN